MTKAYCASLQIKFVQICPFNAGRWWSPFPFPRPTPFPDHRSANLTSWYKDISTRREAPFFSSSHNNHLSSSITICTCQLSTSVIHSLLQNHPSKLQLHSLNHSPLFLTITSLLTPILHLQHNQQNALLTRCRCPGWLCLCLIHASPTREPDQRWTGSSADFRSIPNFRCSC